MTQPSEREESAVQDARHEQLARWRANWADLQAADGESAIDTVDELQALIDKLHLKRAITELQGGTGEGLFLLVPLMAALTLVAYLLGLGRRCGRSWRARPSARAARHGDDPSPPG